MSWKLTIVTYEYNHRNKRETLIGKYESYEKAYDEWITLISRYPECEGYFAITNEEQLIRQYKKNHS